MGYQDYKCRKCQSAFHYSIPRSTLFKTFFGFLPIKIYWCPKCVAKRYVWVKKDG